MPCFLSLVCLDIQPAFLLFSALQLWAENINKRNWIWVMNRILYSSGTATSDEAAADLGMFQSWIMNILLQKWGAATESEHVLGFWAQEKCDGVCVCVSSCLKHERPFPTLKHNLVLKRMISQHAISASTLSKHTLEPKYQQIYTTIHNSCGRRYKGDPHLLPDNHRKWLKMLTEEQRQGN